jgi:hypothetical protein
MITEQQQKYEETIAALSQIQKDKGDDFIVRITRRRKDSSFAEPVGTLAEARLEHFLVGPKTPELWLQKFAGGASTYLLQIFHTSNMEKPIGGLLPVQVPGQPREADPEVVDAPDWVGPGRCIVPEKKGKGGEPPPYMVAPSSPHRPQDATIVERNGGGGTPTLTPPATGIPADAAREIIRQQDEVTRQRLELAEDRRKIEVAQAKREAEAQIAAAKAEAEARARLERERNDRLEREMEKLREEIRTRAAVAQATPTGPAPTDRFAELMMELRRSDQEQRKAEREFQAEQRRLEREAAVERAKIEAEARAESERIRAESAKAQAELQSHLIKVATEKPSGSEMAEKVLLSVTSAISGLMSNQVNMINAMNELGFGGSEEPEPEPRWLKTAERMMRSFAAISQTRQQGQPAQPLPPPNNPQQALPPPPAQSTPVSPQTPPAQVHNFPDGEPSMALVEQLQKAIVGKSHDPGTIAEFILGNMTDPGLQRLLVSKQRLSEIVEDLVGDDWLDDPNNVAFAKAVAQAFVERGSERGLFDADSMKETLADLDTLGQ